MNVASIMTADPPHCRPEDGLDRAVALLWEHGRGAVPVVDGLGHVVGMITDRGVAMGTWAKGRSPAQVPVAVAMGREPAACDAEASLDDLARLMRAQRAGHVAVVDGEGRLLGLVSIGDLARAVAAGADATLRGVTLEAIAAIDDPRGGRHRGSARLAAVVQG